MLHYGLIKVRGQYLYEIVDAPFVVYAIDPTSFMFKNFDGVDFDRIILYTFCQNDADEWRRITHPNIKNITCDKSYPVHPSMIRARPTFEEYKAKNSVAVVTMNCDHNGVLTENATDLYGTLSKTQRTVAERMTEKCLDQVDLLFWDALDQAIEETGVAFSREARLLVYDAAYGVIKLVERQRLVEELVDEPVLFLGRSFPKACVRRQPEKFLRIFNSNTFEVVSHSKVGIAVGNSHCPNPTVRLLGTVLVGSAGMVEETQSNRENYPVGSIHLYDFKSGTASGVLDRILEDDERAYEGVTAAYDFAHDRNLIYLCYDKLFEGIRGFLKAGE